MQKDKSRKDELDEIVMNKEQTEYFRKGKKQGCLESKREYDTNPKPKLTVDQKRMLMIIEDKQQKISNLQNYLRHVTKERDNFDRLLTEGKQEIVKLKSVIETLKVDHEKRIKRLEHAK